MVDQFLVYPHCGEVGHEGVVEIVPYTEISFDYGFSSGYCNVPRNVSGDETVQSDGFAGILHYGIEVDDEVLGLAARAFGHPSRDKKGGAGAKASDFHCCQLTGVNGGVDVVEEAVLGTLALVEQAVIEHI